MADLHALPLRAVNEVAIFIPRLGPLFGVTRNQHALGHELLGHVLGVGKISAVYCGVLLAEVIRGPDRAARFCSIPFRHCTAGSPSPAVS